MTITDEKLREAVEAFKFCIETASNQRIKASEHYIWSAGTRERPSINLEHLDNVLAALAELETLRAAVKNIDYHADILRYTMTQKFSRQELDFARDNLLTACNELTTPPKEASHD